MTTRVLTKYHDLSPDQVHQMVTYLTATEAVLRKHKVEVVTEERRYRLTVNDRLVQVRARRSNWHPTAPEQEAPDTAVVIYVDLVAEEPRFFISDIRTAEVTPLAQWEDRWNLLN